MSSSKKRNASSPPGRGARLPLRSGWPELLSGRNEVKPGLRRPPGEPFPVAAIELDLRRVVSDELVEVARDRVGLVVDDEPAGILLEREVDRALKEYARPSDRAADLRRVDFDGEGHFDQLPLRGKRASPQR